MSFLINGLIGGIGSMMQSDTEAQNDEERARVADFNALVAKQQAKSTMQVAAADTSDFRRAQSARRAASKAAAAGTGFLLEGSPLMVDKAVVQEIEFSTDRMMGNARIAQARLRTQSTLLTREGVIERANATRARQAGMIGLVSGFAGGAAKQFGSLLTTPSSFF